MNSLSWMIYAADVIGGMSAILGLTGGLMIFVFCGWIVFHAVDAGDIGIPMPPKYLAVLGFAFVLIAVALPSRVTIYMIAASEIGQRAGVLEKAGQIADPAFELLRKKITDALAERAK